MQQKKLQTWLPALFALSMAVGLFLGYKMRDSFPTKSFFQTDKTKPVQEVIDLINQKYVDSVQIAALTDTAIQALLTKLDPHSYYIEPSMLEAANEDIAGSFFGIGIEFDILQDTLNVIQVIKNGPAEKAGLLSGDKIIAADKNILAGVQIQSDDVRKILKGSRGSVVELKIRRNGKEITASVTRDIVHVNSVASAYMIDDTTGFIHLDRFTQQTYREFMIELEKLVKAGMTQLIFDLRGNGGGIMDAAVEIADEFLDSDKLITYTQGLHTPRTEFRSRRNGMFEKGKIIFLADEGTASASEILIGALQDWDRAIIIGRRTFGKGLVQEQFDLSNKGAIRLTIARYYTPLGRSIQRSYLNGSEGYFNEIHNGKAYTDSTATDSTGVVFVTPKGKKLYEGGGITPDYYMGNDTGSISYAMAYIYSNRYVSKFSYRYVTEHPEIFKAYPTPEAFSSHFTINESAMQYFNSQILKDSVNTNSLNNTERAFLEKSMKLNIARQLWGNEGYYKVFNVKDDAVQKALEVLRKQN